VDDALATLKGLFPERLHKRLFLVGGMVRDILLGVPYQDFDLAAAIAPADLTSLGFRLVESKSTPNIYFLFHKVLGKVEVTALPSLEALDDDLVRRDFTVNAMAMNLDGIVQDPMEGGRDLKLRVLRTCSPTSLTDDPARIFRAFRFECDGWRLDDAAEAAISARSWSADFATVPVERFSQEMLKALGKKDPCQFFRRMLQLKVGENYLPEIFRMPQVPAGPIEHHPEGDLFTHSMQTLERIAASTPEVKARFCGLFHDLGKLSTPEDQYPKHHGHDQAGALAADPFCKRLRLPVTLQRALQAICRLHNNANHWEELRESTKIKIASGAIKAGIETILPLVVAADFGGELPDWENALKVVALNAAQLGIPKELVQNPEFPPEKVQQMIMQRRVEELKSMNRAADVAEQASEDREKQL
jgi:tRNA nucleotidyltransferase (CCA-adding enzyme)